ncbi:MAG: YihY/virulence factor BrkB family protein [Weeksellaceae bacterium]
MNYSLLSLNYWKTIGRITIRAAKNFMDDKCMKMSASLAYYSIFSIGPLLLIVIWLLGFFYGEHLEDSTAQQEVLSGLSEVLGSEVAEQIKVAMGNLAISTQSKIGVLVGIGTLIFTSTTIFIEIQDSINTIWGIKPKPKKSWLKFIIDRLTSFSMVIGLGFLLITSLLINSLLLILMNFFFEIIPGISNQMLNNINVGLTFLITTTIFGFIYKVLPDAKVRNRDIIGGAVFTALLFMLGRFGISFYLENNATANAFGAAGSIIILLLWVYYSAAILYYGAEFTKEYSFQFDKGIEPSPYAVLVDYKEVEYDPEENLEE